jgi:hypothetical protein
VWEVGLWGKATWDGVLHGLFWCGLGSLWVVVGVIGRGEGAGSVVWVDGLGEEGWVWVRGWVRLGQV